MVYDYLDLGDERHVPVENPRGLSVAIGSNSEVFDFFLGTGTGEATAGYFWSKCSKTSPRRGYWMKARVQEDFTRMSVGASFWVLRTNVEDHHFFLLSLVHRVSGKLDCCVAECGLRRGNATWYRLVYA